METVDGGDGREAFGDVHDGAPTTSMKHNNDFTGAISKSALWTWSTLLAQSKYDGSFIFLYSLRA